jgi:hypothetical protein
MEVTRAVLALGDVCYAEHTPAAETNLQSLLREFKEYSGADLVFQRIFRKGDTTMCSSRSMIRGRRLRPRFASRRRGCLRPGSLLEMAVRKGATVAAKNECFGSRNEGHLVA